MNKLIIEIHDDRGLVLQAVREVESPAGVIGNVIADQLDELAKQLRARPRLWQVRKLSNQ